MDAYIKRELRIIGRNIKNVATKDDLKDFVTKEDAKNFSTKDDLKGFATKDDLKGFATKDDLKRELKSALKDYLTTEKALGYFVSRNEFEEFRDYVMKNMFTKKDYMDHMSMLDKMLCDYQRMSENNILVGRQLCDLDDQVAQHGRRITKLEEQNVR